MRVSDTQILAAILSSPSQKVAAEKLNVSEQTLCKRLKSPQLKTQLSEYRNTALEAVANRIVSQNENALDTIVRLLNNSESENMQFQAACKILSFGAEITKILDIQNRLNVLEEKFNQS